MIKVAFISRSTLFSSPGGDTCQVQETAKNLRRKDVSVDICLTNQRINYQQYDLLHFFNIIRPADILKHIKLSGKPYVVSTIFVQYGSVTTGGKMDLLRKIFSEDGLEYIKVIARALKNGEKIASPSYIWMGHRRSVQYVAKHAACLLPNSESEYKRFSTTYNLQAQYHVVPNGIDTELTKQKYPINEKYKNSILCMGRIESRKNQLNLIRALNNTSYQVFIHGKASPNAAAYLEQCKKEAASNIHIDGWLDENDLYTAYSNAKVHILPSYFETTGLSTLEAAVMGCNIVVTDKGDTRDYFKDYAGYCEPDDIISIKNAVDAAYKAPYSETFKQYILQHYTWERAAEETLTVYKKVLNSE